MNPTDYSMYCKYRFFLEEILRETERRIIDLFEITNFNFEEDLGLDDPHKTLRLIFSGENPEAPAIVLAWSELANEVMLRIPGHLCDKGVFAADDGFGIWPVLALGVEEEKYITPFIELSVPSEELEGEELKIFVEDSLRDQLQDFLDTVEKFYFAPMRLIIDKAGESIDLFD